MYVYIRVVLIIKEAKMSMESEAKEIYSKAKTEQEIKEIYFRIGFKVTAMIALKRVLPNLSLREIAYKTDEWGISK